MIADEPTAAHRSRRDFLRAGATAGALATTASLSGCIGIILGGGYYQNRRGAQQARQQRGNDRSSISFASQRKRITQQDATVIIHNRSELVSAVQKPDAVVWIPEGVTVDMTGDTKNPVAPGVTIASDRNLGTGKDGKGGKGGQIKTTGYDQRIFIVPEGDCRVTGIRLQGPTTQYLDPPYDTMYNYAASAIHFQGTAAIVDNCELSGWPSFAVGLGTKSTATQGWIHHNYAHHCQMSGLGYFVESYNGLALVEWNDFSHYRHAISGYGYKTNGYESRFNRVGPAPNDPSAWAFDMHSLGEQDDHPDSNTTGGKYLNIHHNVFQVPDSLAISLSGIPTMYARFCRNWCSREEIIDGEAGAELRVKQNRYGPQAVTQGRQRLKQLAAQLPLSNGKPSIKPWTPPTNQPSKTPTEGS